MRQLLLGLDHCHSHGILHRDIKGSNLLIDQNGNLKIGDFGLATFFQQKQPLTSRVVTLWYRPPELLLGATDYGVAVDLWSSGCILAELFAGKPIMPGRTEVLFPSFSWILRNMQVLYTELDVLNLYPVSREATLGGLLYLLGGTILVFKYARKKGF